MFACLNHRYSGATNAAFYLYLHKYGIRIDDYSYFSN